MSRKVVPSTFLFYLLLVTLTLRWVSAAPIVLDGDPNDWAGILPILVDKKDAPYDNCDIKELYMTRDDVNLYFRIDVYGSISATAGFYFIEIDTDLNSATGVKIENLGADYILSVSAGRAFLWKWIGLAFPSYETTIIDLPVAWAGSVLEISVPLSAIGSPPAVQVTVSARPVDVFPESTYVSYIVGTNVANITVDGSPVDWGTITPIGTDQTGDAADPSMDITYCYVANDPSGYIYIRMDISGPMDPLLDSTAFLDEDQNPSTGLLLPPWNIGADDFPGAFNVGGTILEGKSSKSYPVGTKVNLVFQSTAYKYTDRAPQARYIVSNWLTKSVTLDGRMTTIEEWSDAIPIELPLLERHIGPRWVPAKIWMKNDDKWLYMLYRIEWPSGDTDPNDDAFICYLWEKYPWEHSDIGIILFGNWTWDGYGWDETRWYSDVEASPPGENNVEGAATYDGIYYWFEFRKRLNSGDGYDWSLTPGQIYGWKPPDLIVGVWDSSQRSAYEVSILLKLSPPPSVGGEAFLITIFRDDQITLCLAVFGQVAVAYAIYFINQKKRF